MVLGCQHESDIPPTSLGEGGESNAGLLRRCPSATLTVEGRPHHAGLPRDRLVRMTEVVELHQRR
jgi:hypothetical protein